MEPNMDHHIIASMVMLSASEKLPWKHMQQQETASSFLIHLHLSWIDQNALRSRHYHYCQTSFEQRKGDFSERPKQTYPTNSPEERDGESRPERFRKKLEHYKMKLGISSALLAVALLAKDGEAFTGPASLAKKQQTSLFSTVSETSAMMKDMQKQLNENEDARMVMDALRGKNLNDDDAALDGLQMRLVDVGGVDATDPTSGLPYEYNPKALQEFFSKRPLTILQRLLQLTSVGGGLAFQLALDALLGRVKVDGVCQLLVMGGF